VFLVDPARRAPASEGDVLGWIGLGCVLENVWPTAQSLGLGCQVLASVADEGVRPALSRVLRVPDRLRIALGCRLGYPSSHEEPPRVRRAIERWAHHNTYATPLAAEPES
jgi:nitroreductase